MMREAESHADEDKKRREEIEARNRADQAVYGAERLHQGHGRQADAPPTGRRSRAAMEALKKAIEANDAAAIQQRAGAADAGAAQGGRGALQAAGARRRARRAATAARAAGRRRGAAAPAPRRPKGDVIDAEVVDEGKVTVRLRIADARLQSPKSQSAISNQQLRWISTSSSASSAARRSATSSARTSGWRGGTIRTSIRATGWRRRSSARSPRRTRR